MEGPHSYRCYICDMFSAFYDFGMQYGQSIYKALLPPSRILFTAYVTAWVAWYIVFKGILRGDFRFGYFLKKSLLFVFVESLLQGSDFFWVFIHTPFLELISALAQKIVTLGKISPSDPTFRGMLLTVDQSLSKTIFEIWNILIGEGGWLSWKPILAAFILIIPYLFVICIFLAFLLEFIFAFLIITAICPLLYSIMCFKSLHSILLNAVRITLHGAMTLLFSSIAMGFTIEIFHKFSPLIPIGPEGASEEISDFIFSSQYWAIWILGFLSVFFHLKASYFAKQISCFSYQEGLSFPMTESTFSLFGNNLRKFW
ncbi:MAG: type IV secretion system protein [Proteobacteria bacterium]|nr:type IV secretion system protein [Pseudomonadota bacterium]